MVIKESVINILEDVLENTSLREQMKQNDNILMQQLGINSVSFIKLIVEIEKKFNIEFTNDALDYSKFENLDSLCKYIQNRKDSSL